MTETAFNFDLPEYNCPKHGVIDQTMSCDIKGSEGVWCLRCVVEWVGKNVPKLEEDK